MKTIILILLGLGILGGGGWYWYYRHNAAPAVTFRTAELARGEVVPTISATGTIEPQDVVDVGAQVQGQILRFGEDSEGKSIDYTSPVEENMVLANIDPTTYAADLGTAKASLAQAEAAVKSANATRDQMDAKLYQATSDWERAQKLKSGEALSESDYNNYQAAFKTANANRGVAVAAIAQAEAGVLQAKAAVDKAQRNLDFCTIKSPVKGVVIDRRVNIGQTVVASLNTPSLFLIAKDLTQVEVWVSVNEADIGKVHLGQPVTFTVDAFPGHSFRGEVGKVRLNATMTQNVVTYTVEVNTDNSDSKLLPYMTANVQFEISRRKDVLLVPNAALRWYPQPEMVAADVRAAMADKSKKPAAEVDESPDTGKSAHKNAKKAHAGPTSKPTTKPVNNEPHGHGTLWVLDGKFVRPVKVRTGATDGINTEIAFTGDPLPVGTQLVTGEQHIQTTDNGTTNPFAPQPIFGHRH